ncbi:hypothetical protein RBH29_05660 [Herbivorax sp. ANBcel31]|uniref:hypothetical protein n=1 Tax=Herbivorax sp. ANBcel31 TaxID=3069754 RepID=UPI0027B7BEAB|nr:hypothetical protein [Herbivorax sp. ANBcel31]MDQ2085924.1 hypothetical protein [Herbivorax sp. ANBcel31]
MAKNIIFLGASASVSEGAPSQSNLFRDYFNELINTPNEKKDNHIYRYFSDFWGINIQKGKIDGIVFPTFEEALGMLELAKNRRECFQGLSYDSIDHIIEDLIFLIADILKRKLVASNFHYTNLIHKLIDNHKIKDTVFISLNYDILIDNAITGLHEYIDLDYCIDFMNYQFEDNWKPPNINNCTKLFKIHGSLNWLYCPVCKQIKLTSKMKGFTQLIKKMETSRYALYAKEDSFLF